MKRAQLAVRWFNVLLRLLPSRVRSEYGADMQLMFEDRLRDRRGAGIGFVVRESAAVLRFGIVERLAPGPGVVIMRQTNVVEASMSSVRAAVRTVTRSPGFAVMAVLILGVGIGLTTAIFSALHAVLLRPSPYADVDRLVNVERTTGEADAVLPWPHAHFELMRDRGGPFTDVTAYGTRAVTLTGQGEPARLMSEFVSANYFALLGMMPRFGRVHAAGAATEREVVISHRAWQDRFGGGDVLGVSITVNGGPLTVVGIMPPGFHGESGEAELWLPVELSVAVLGDQSLLQPFVMWLDVIARLRDGVTPQLAAEQLMVMSEALELEGEYPLTLGAPLAVQPLHGSRIEPAFRRALVLTFAAAALLMVIVCLNISSLLLVRVQDRDREMAIRTALGASRRRLVSQLVTESLLLALAGGLVGVAIAYASLDVLAALRPSPTPGFWSSYARALDVNEFRLDARVLAFMTVLTLLAGLVSGLLPALRTVTTDFGARVGVAAPTGAGGGRAWPRARAGIVIAEIGLAFVLTAAAGLVATSLIHMQRERLGFEAEAVTTMRLQLPASTHTRDQAKQFFLVLLDRVGALPGVMGASLSSGLPVTGRGGTADFVPEERTGEDLPTVDVVAVTADYFDTFGIPLRTGRGFDGSTTGPFPVVVSATAANMYWPDENPIGKRAYTYVASDGSEPVEVVGVVEDVQYRGVGDDIGPMFYLPIERLGGRTLFVNVRANTPPAPLAAALRAEVRRLDPGLAITEVRTMRERVGAATSRARFSAVLVTVFASVAALLAVLGVYGLVSHTVRQRRREFGVRLALGGQPREIIRDLMRDVIVISVAGVAIGLAGAFATARAIQSQLFGVAATDPRLLGASALMLLIAAAAAAWLPALGVLRISASAELMRD